MKMELSYIEWISTASKSEAMSGIRADTPIILADDENSWGFFRNEHNQKIVVGYADIGLKPQAASAGDTLFIGINELLVGIESESLAVKFRYKMPWLFHEFIQYDSSLLVRDEIGFVNIAKDGRELWERLTSSPIDVFRLEGSCIAGVTIDGDSFHFEIGG